MFVLGLAIVFTHLYWFLMRYHFLKEDGIVEMRVGEMKMEIKEFKISNRDLNVCLVRKSADLFSNYAAVILTGISWYFVMRWMRLFSSVYS